MTDSGGHADCSSYSSYSSSSQEEERKGGGTNTTSNGADPVVVEYLRKLELWPAFVQKFAADPTVTRRVVMAVWLMTEPKRKAGERIGALARSILENHRITEHDLRRADEALAPASATAAPTAAVPAEAGWDEGHRANVARLRPLGSEGVKQLAISHNHRFYSRADKTAWMQANWLRYEDLPDVAAALVTMLPQEQGVARG